MTYLFFGITLRGGYFYVTCWDPWGTNSERDISIARCFLGSGLRINSWGRFGKEAGLSRVRPWLKPSEVLSQPYGALELGRPFQLPWLGWGIQAFAPLIDQLLDVSYSWKEVWPWERQFSQPRQSSKRANCWRPSSGNTSSRWEGESEKGEGQAL